MAANKRKILSIEETGAIVARLENRNRQKIKDPFNDNVSNKKILHRSAYDDIEAALLQWFKEKRSNGIPIRGPVLPEKPEEIGHALGKESYRCSESWVKRFRDCHQIVPGKNFDKSGTVNTEICKIILHEPYYLEIHKFPCRCAIPGCDSNITEYNATWLINAVPYKDGKPSKCSKFQHVGSSCNSLAFNRTVNEACDSFVYETPVKSILEDFNLHCDENIKFLVLVGTMNGLGRVCGLPIIGFMSDRYGRKTILIWSMVIAGCFGLIRSFAHSYGFFVACEFLEAAFSSGGITSGYVLGTEFVGPGKRTFVGAFQFASYAVGSIVLGITAWQVQSWRTLLRILYSFYLLILSYYWFMPESVRWLLHKNRHEEAINTLRKIAKVNGNEISQGKLENLLNNINVENSPRTGLIDLFKSKMLVVRCFMCCFCWFSAIMVYYGLTIVSTTLSGHRYLDFILTCSIEVPAVFVALIILNKLGRKVCLVVAFTLSTLSSISYVVIPTDTQWIKLLMYLVSKFGISMSVSAVYTITNELFPTSIRQTLLSICSMFGRLGNIVVPQLIVLVDIWKNFPLVIFAGTTGTAAIVTLFFPETRNITLPESIQDSKNVGKREKRKNLTTETNHI